jgi:hypothetical protein
VAQFLPATESAHGGTAALVFPINPVERCTTMGCAQGSESTGRLGDVPLHTEAMTAP